MSEINIDFPTENYNIVLIVLFIVKAVYFHDGLVKIRLFINWFSVLIFYFFILIVFKA